MYAKIQHQLNVNAHPLPAKVHGYAAEDFTSGNVETDSASL
jgi:hypothetical protein